MLNVRSIVLGSTPVKTSSALLASRRRLFRTPTPSTNNVQPMGPQQEDPQQITIASRPGTMVAHTSLVDADFTPRTGVVLRTTAGPSPRTLDVLWNSSGQISTVLPRNLRLYSPAKPPPIPAIRRTRDLDFGDSASSDTRSTASRNSVRTYRP